MLLRLVGFFLTLCTHAAICHGARILGIFQMPAYSHYTLGSTYMIELARRGHEVTAIVPFQQKKPVKNYNEVVLTGFVEFMEETKKNMFEDANMNTISKEFVYNMMGLGITEKTLSHPVFQKLLSSGENYDLIIIEQFLNDALHGLSHHFKAPLIIFSTIGASRWINPQVANPSMPSYIPDLLLSYTGNMSFTERAYNFFIYVLSDIFKHLYVFPKHEELMHKYIPGTPHLSELYYNTSLILINSHVSINQAVPHVPSMIEIGGFHVKPPKQLPKDIQELLDKAPNGVIYFSMGSNLKSKDMDTAKKSAILKAFSKLKETVLWKFEDENLVGKPDNVIVAKWWPQSDILAHPKVKLFITHGGLLSTTETIYHGVPVIGIPVFGDQDLNTASAVANGYGLGVPYAELTEEKLSCALTEMLNNPKYRLNAQRRSKIFHDQETKPLDRAAFWTEYVIRHKGAPHLRSTALNLTWYQYLLLDVVAMYVLIDILIVVVVCWIIKICFSKKKPSSKKGKAKQN